jgi:HAD superfamily hydrolase (TIGR01509 family)
MSRALIFDLDGTLADTMPSHYEAWSATLEKYGMQMSEDRFYELGGWPTLAVAELAVNAARQPAFLAKRMADEKEALFEKSLALIRPVSSVLRIAEENRGKLPMAVATGATRDICNKVLQHLGASDWFDVKITSEDVPTHKPEPDIFLEAARQLGVEPADCRVYEDTDPGIEAARRAGMEFVDVRTFYKPRRVTPLH